ncbi:MAG: thioredoxin domain-containing protein [Acidobacteriaceae bacterium]|nr:thioredoxin domain-containing protein [Acidobacteriaceae bacterium]
MAANRWAIMTLFAAFTAAGLAGADGTVPKLNKPKLESYIRYVEAYTAAVNIDIHDPEPSAFPGYSRVLVRVSLHGRSGGDKVYYATADGEHFFSGALWQLGQNPFLDTLVRLPQNGPSFGPANAKVSITVFSDFQCPYCREFARTIRDNIPKQHPNDVRVIYKDFPLDAIHPWARTAAEWAHCITDQNPAAFWTFHDWIFQHQGEIDNKGTNLKEKMLGFAAEQKLDGGKLAACVDTHVHAPDVAASIAAASALGVQQTPTSFFNGRMVGGSLKWDDMNSLIQFELNRPADIPGPPASESKDGH